jgi:uncharacterized protein
MLAGVVGTVIPLLPGIPLVYVAAVGSWYVLGWSAGTWVGLVVVTVLAVVGMVATVVMPARRGAQAGMPRTSMLTGLAGAVIGFFVIPVVGVLVGGVAGIALAEQRRLGDTAAARRSTEAALRGFGVGVAVEAVTAITMVLVWAATLLLT